MIIKTTTAPTLEPVTLTEAKLHLRLATTVEDAVDYTNEDDLLDSIIETARVQAEQETGRALITQTKTYYLNAWPEVDYITVPYPPLQSATVTYRLEGDSGYDNTLSTVDVDIISEPGKIILQTDETWPTGTLYSDKPIKITIVCGYGDDAADVPTPIKQAMLLKISDLYENRGSVYVGVVWSRNQDAIDSLLRSYQVHTEFE